MREDSRLNPEFVGETERYVYARNKRATEGLLDLLKAAHAPEQVEPPKPAPAFKEPWFSIVVDPAEQQEPRKVLVAEIQCVVGRHYGVTRADILSGRRSKKYVIPRQVAAYLCKCMTVHSFAEIGRRFGGRDHSTMLHSYRKIEGLLPSDEDLAARVAIIEAELTA